jgi:predicted HicB family RNase H-like nuclease
MHIMSRDDDQAKIEYDAELDLFRGESLGQRGGADVYGRTPEALRTAFRQSWQVFLDVCREKGIEPRRQRYPATLRRPLTARLGIRHQADDWVASVSQREAAQAVRQAQEFGREVQAHLLPRGKAS